MPLYEYECTQCKLHTEKIQKFSDPEITECPHCGGRLERVVSAPAIAFKGGGWYADGYGNAKPPSAKGESKGDSGSTGGASSDTSGSASKDTSSAPASTGSSSTATSAAAAPAAPAASGDKK
jgi:putative FmdB family regulatory protein